MRRPTTSEPNGTGPTGSEARAVCMDDFVADLFTDESAFASFAAWIDADLKRLEAQFADYATVDSLGSKSRRSF